MRDEVVSVLSWRAPLSQASARESGLIVGCVRTGKTLSFTTVAALARDNGYAVVIVIAGTSKPLTEQSRQRLRNELRFDQRNDRCWRHLHDPEVRKQDHTRIDTTLADWRDPDVPPAERSTVLITVMKHHNHLSHLIQVLRQVDIADLPVLIV